MPAPVYTPPPSDCPLCPRLSAFRAENRRDYPSFFNNPVPSFGNLDAELLVVGLAPGLKGANQTGRPFTGDYAGIVLYEGLIKHGFAQGTYRASKDDGLHLNNCRITNAVRCVPPQNKPDTAEIKTCNRFLTAEIAAMPRLRVVLCLGQISHNAVLRALSLTQGAYKFAHGAQHCLPAACGPRTAAITLMDSYHCSRYNINTGALTVEMFEAVLRSIRVALSAPIANTAIPA